MAKKKAKTGRVINVSPEDRRLFRQYLLDLEDIGVYKNPTEVASDLFAEGLHNAIKTLKNK